MNITQLKFFKKSAEKITCLTAYDASFARLFEDCGVDIILVGDSLGNVIQGGENTLSVSMDDMVYHTKLVANGVQNTLLIVDMPYQSYIDVETVLSNAKRLLNAGATMLKIEGGIAHKDIFKALQKNHIPVCGHLGLQPQSILKLGGYKVQGKDVKSADKILKDALALESWGVGVIVLECIPKTLSAKVSSILEIPTIGIGAGIHCDGQVLVSYDMLGISGEITPKFVKFFLKDADDIKGAINEFIKAVKNKTFPTDKHSY